MITRNLLIGSLVIYSLTHAAPTSTYHQIKDLATKFAPVFWLHSEEIYFPSSLEYHFQNCHLRDANETLIEEHVTMTNIPIGDDSQGLHLNSKTPLPSPQSGDLPFFKGQSLDDVPVYTFVRIIESQPLELEIKYDLFFPYNRGKDACEGIPTEDGCIGKEDSFGHHVGDWEGITIHVKDESIYEIYISVHSFGAYYRWDGQSYNMYYGEDVGSSLLPFDCIDPEYPLYASVQDQAPVAFIANGSHGMWAGAGKHYYCKVIDLYDETDEGIKLESQDKLQLYVWDDNKSPTGEWRFLNYHGLYGNLKQGCQLEFMVGECNLDNGPSGPTSAPNSFPAPTSKRGRTTSRRKTESTEEVIPQMSNHKLPAPETS